MFCRVVMFLLMLFVSGLVHAQVCPPGRVDSAKLGQQLTQAGRQFDQFHPDDPDESGPPVDPDIIYRASAIGGKALVPALRGISKPWMAPDSVPGAAQVSLAKLGVEEAKQQLIEEFEAIEKPLGTAARTWWAPRKLARVGNDWSVSIMMNYFVGHSGETAGRVSHGDYREEPALNGVIRELNGIIRDPPASFGIESPEAISQWTAWWAKYKSGSVVWSLHDMNLQDPQLQCLARKIDWGFPDAIIDLATIDGRQAIPLLKYLAEVGDKREPVAPFDSVRGHAQTALAIVGEKEQFNAIVHELDTLRFTDAVAKLRVIGGARAVATLVHGFDSPIFLADRPDYTADKAHIEGIVYDHDEAIASALTKIVVSPPDASGSPKSKGKWIDWWNRNKETAQFVQRPIYE